MVENNLIIHQESWGNKLVHISDLFIIMELFSQLVAQTYLKKNSHSQKYHIQKTVVINSSKIFLLPEKA